MDECSDYFGVFEIIPTLLERDFFRESEGSELDIFIYITNQFSSMANQIGSALRQQLIDVALEWQKQFGVAPAITPALSEYDAAILVGCSEEECQENGQSRTAVTRGHDFKHNNIRYQVKGNRPSGKPGSPVTIVVKATNYDWDKLIWILYDTQYNIQEAWEWDADGYKREFYSKQRISPSDMRKGKNLLS